MKNRLEELRRLENSRRVITELTLRNFKAFGETQRVPIRPLTLIFGANSAGKSSIIQGLLLARHLWHGGDPDARTLQGLAESVDLGGFHQFVHGQNGGLEVGLGLAFSLPQGSSTDMLRGAPDGQLRVEIGLAAAPDATGKAVGVHGSILNSGVELGRVVRLPSGLYQASACDALAQRLPDPETRAEVVQILKKTMSESPNMTEEIRAQMQSFLAIYESRSISTSKEVLPPSETLWPRISDVESAELQAVDDEEYNRIMPKGSRTENWYDQRYFLSGVSRQFDEPLVYLGPLRYHPPRRLSEPQIQDPAWRSGGGAAWWKLQENDDARANANRALRELGLDYQLDVHRWADTKRLGREFRELIITDTKGRILSARDVGVGISQILPVLMLATMEKGALLAVEQPEVHLHPALQAELGDVFIKSALGEQKNTFLIETHSEHLILRILRRVRETTEAKAKGLPVALPVRPEDVEILFVEAGENGSRVIKLPVTEDGDFSVPWPGGFFPERVPELF